MLALSGLVLAAMLLSSPGAHAGSWRFHCAPATSNDKVTTDAATVSHPGYPPSTRHTETAWVAPSDSSNAMDIHTPFTLSDTITGPGSTCQAALSVTMNITATWVPDPTLPSDPAPPTVETIETAGASRSGTNGDGTDATGSVSNGLDPASTTVTSVVTPSTDASGKTLVPPVHLMKWSGGSFSFTRTFSVSASASNGSAGGTCSAGVALNVYRIQIHATPYNWHVTNGQGQVNSDGTLYYAFDYSSTDGDKTHLTSCYEHERVTYQGPNPFPPPYPFTQSLRNPTVLSGVGDQGYLLSETQYLWIDTQHVVAFSPPPYSQFTGTSFTATQKIQFDDIATGEADVLIPGPDSLNTIKRSIESRPGYPPSQWWYSCTKTNSAGGSLKSWLPAAQN